MKWQPKYKFTSRCHSQTTPLSECRHPDLGNVFISLCWQANLQLCHRVLKPQSLLINKYDIQIYTNLPVDAIVRQPDPPIGDSQGQETFIPPTCNYDIECSNHHLLLSTIRPKALSRSKMKWQAIYINLTVDAIVWLPHPRSTDSQGQETFLTYSADKQTHN